ncbi:hypothetical protein HN51_028289 [Arachis hypogaea]
MGPFFVNGLPFGAMDAIKATYGATIQIKDLPRDGLNLTLKINLSKLPANQDQRQSFLVKIASVREVVLGAPLRVILKYLASRTVAPDIDPLVTLVHRPRELFFLVPKFISHKPQELPKEIRVILDIKGVSGVKGRLVKMEIRASTCVEEKEEVGA